MESYSIACTTCSAKLKVRHEELVGQILPCPKCGAMVMVQPPTNRLTLGHGPVDSQEVTRESIAPSENQEVSTEASDVTESTENSDELNSDEFRDDVQVPSPDNWERSPSGRLRQILQITAVAAMALATAAALFGLFVRASINQSHREQQPVASHVDDDPSTASEESSSTDPSDVNQENIDSDDEDPTKAVPDDADDQTLREESSDESPTSEEGNRIDTDQDTPDEGASGEAVELDPGGEPPDRKFTQPGLPPSGEGEFGTIEALPEGLKQFGDIFEANLGLGNEPTGEDAPSTIDDVRFGNRPGDDDHFPPAEQPVDVQRQLGRRSPSIDIRAMPFASFITWFSELTEIPITIDLESLDAGSIDVTVAVSGRFIDKPGEPLSYGEVLDEILGSIGCTRVPTDDGQLTVLAKDELALPLIEQALIVGPEFANAKEIAAKAVQVASTKLHPLKIDDAHGSKRLMVSGSTKAMWRSALFLDAIRICRGIDPAIEPQRSRRWIATDFSERWGTVDDLPISFESYLARPVTAWIREAADRHDAVVVVDWPTIWQRGMTPTTMNLPWTSETSTHLLFSELLSRHGLIVAQAGPNLWAVSTDKAMGTTAMFVAIDAGDSDPHDLLKRIANAADYTNLAAFPGVVDEESNHIICRLPNFMIKQLPRVLESAVP